MDGIDQNLSQWVGEDWVDLGVEGAASNIDQEVSGDLLFNFEFFEEFEGLSLCELDTFNESSWMNSISDISFSLPHELSNEKNIGGGSISDNIILSCGSSADHGSGWMLDLHLVEKHGSILGELDLTSSSNKHLDGSLWSKVALEHLLEPFGGVDVDTEGLSLSDDVGVCVYELKRRHIWFTKSVKRFFKF